MKINILNQPDQALLLELNLTFLDDNKNLKAVSYSDLKKFKQEDLAAWCHMNAFYCLPTTELIEWLKNEIPDLSQAIEIGCGNACIGRELDIPHTDSKLQDRPDIQKYYSRFNQPVIQYPRSVIQMHAKAALRHFRPRTVIAAWVTQLGTSDGDSCGYGVNEEKLLKEADRYIFIGNEDIHGSKKILQYPHKEYRFPWICSRSLQVEKNVIYVWEK